MVLKVYHFQNCAFLLAVHGVKLTSASMQLSHWQNKNKMVFNAKDLVLIKVLRQGKGYDN